MIPRGIRNRNPANIRKSNDDWIGLAQIQSDPEFFIFSHEKYGIRAASKILQNYQKRYGINTITGIINRWAPNSENDTQSYIKQVAKNTGFGENEGLNLNHKPTNFKILKAIFHHENGGNPYSDDLIYEGIELV